MKKIADVVKKITCYMSYAIFQGVQQQIGCQLSREAAVLSHALSGLAHPGLTTSNVSHSQCVMHISADFTTIPMAKWKWLQFALCLYTAVCFDCHLLPLCHCRVWKRTQPRVKSQSTWLKLAGWRRLTAGCWQAIRTVTSMWRRRRLCCMKMRYTTISATSLHLDATLLQLLKCIVQS